MIRNILFYNRDGRWFANLPDYIEQGGTEDDCEMIRGADEWLDVLAEGSDRVWLKMSETNPLTEKIYLHGNDEYGATYVAISYNNQDVLHKLWLCPVTLFLFEKYPSTIYYEKLKIWD